MEFTTTQRIDEPNVFFSQIVYREFKFQSYFRIIPLQTRDAGLAADADDRRRNLLSLPVQALPEKVAFVRAPESEPERSGLHSAEQNSTNSKG